MLHRAEKFRASRNYDGASEITEEMIARSLDGGACR
jgi:hypothetical protein